jgi:hypothetical protein
LLLCFPKENARSGILACIADKRPWHPALPEFRLVREVVDQLDEMIQGELIEAG